MPEPYEEEKRDKVHKILDQWTKETAPEVEPSEEFRARVLDKMRAEGSKQRQWTKGEKDYREQTDTGRER
jgi:hypothetical protein